MCSSAVPLLFPYQHDPDRKSNQFYFDGGTALIIDIPGAINHCTEQGYNDEDIVLDAIFCTSAHLPLDWDPKESYRPL